MWFCWTNFHFPLICILYMKLTITYPRILFNLDQISYLQLYQPHKIDTLVKHHYQPLGRVLLLLGCVGEELCFVMPFEGPDLLWTIAWFSLQTLIYVVWLSSRDVKMHMILTWHSCLSDRSSFIIGARADFFSTIIEFNFLTCKTNPTAQTECFLFQFCIHLKPTTAGNITNSN